MDCSRIRRAPTSAAEVHSHVVGCEEAPSIKDGIGMSIRGKEVDVGIASDEEAWRRREAMALVRRGDRLDEGENRKNKSDWSTKFIEMGRFHYAILSGFHLPTKTATRPP